MRCAAPGPARAKVGCDSLPVPQMQPWEHDGADHGADEEDGSGSSDGRGSSYFSGEARDAKTGSASPMPSHASASGSRGGDLWGGSAAGVGPILLFCLPFCGAHLPPGAHHDKCEAFMPGRS